MWLSDRRTFLLSATALVAGCGFTPVYGPGGDAEALRGTIVIENPRDPFGFALVRQLERRLGLPSAPRYRLGASIFTTVQELGVTLDQVTTRYNILGRATYRVVDINTEAPIATGSVESFTSYSATGTPVAEQSARADARERLMVILADQIVADLLLTAGDWRQ